MATHARRDAANNANVVVVDFKIFFTVRVPLNRNRCSNIFKIASYSAPQRNREKSPPCILGAKKDGVTKRIRAAVARPQFSETSEIISEISELHDISEAAMAP
jgi:hypothetical protein